MTRLNHQFSIAIKHWTKSFLTKWMLIALISAMGLNLAQAQSGQPKTTLPELTNLQAIAQEAQQKNLPIMLMFGATWCEFCHTLRREVLNPMELGGLYQGKYVVMRHIVIDHELTMPGFDGKPLNMRTWSNAIHADLTPTLVFFNSQGQEIAPRIVGISTLELFASLIHQRLNTGLAALNNPLRLPAMPEDLVKHTQS